jgi:hypothetical protein
MNLEYFVNLVEEPYRVHSVHNGGTRRQDEVNSIDVLFEALIESNLLATNIVFQSGGYGSPLGREGIVMIKQEQDYEADDEHYVYRAVFIFCPGCSIRNNTEERRRSTRQTAIERLLEQSMDVPMPDHVVEKLNGHVAIEVTQYGRMDERNLPELPAPREWSAGYNFNYNILSNNLTTDYAACRRGNRYSLINSNEGLVGEVKLKALQNYSMTPLTKEDMTFARGFTKLENDYTGWIPNEVYTAESMISTEAFSVHYIRETDRSIKATTVLEKTKNRRTYFNSKTQLKHDDKRYTLQPGEYFFSPTSDISLMSIFDYDVWLSLVSATITMTKTNSRVGFLSASAEYQDVKSINVKAKEIEVSNDQEVERTFTRRAKSGRLK